MGTSEGYELPEGTGWQGTKKNFSTVAGEIDDNTGRISKQKLGLLIRGFVESAGSSSGYSRSGSGLGNSKAAVSAGHGIGQFISEISEEGAEKTFRNHFGNSLDGKSADDICLELVEFFCDEATHINSADAKHAMYDLLKELLNEANNLEEVEEKFDDITNDEELNSLLERFFGYYVYEQINRSFFSYLEERYGLEAAKKLLEQDIRDYVLERISEEGKSKDLLNQDFSKPESVGIVEKILQEVTSIFE